MKTNQKGFTLMEMLIVVAIIAILIAIGIVTLSNELEKAREAADAANLRAAYAEVMARVLTGEDDAVMGIYDKASGAYTKMVEPTQRMEGWQNKSITQVGEFFTSEEAAKAAGVDGAAKNFKLINSYLVTWVVVYNENLQEILIY